MCTIFPLFQSPGTSSKCHFSNIMARGLATRSANSLSTLGFLSSDPINLCTFRVLRWSWTWPSLSVGGTLLSQSLILLPIHLRGVGREAAIEDWSKILGTPAFSCSTVTSFPALFMGGRMYTFFDLPFLVKLPVGALSVIVSLASFRSSFALASPYLYTAALHPYTLPRSTVLPSIASTFSSFPLVWPAGPYICCNNSKLRLKKSVVLQKKKKKHKAEWDRTTHNI